jgi:hypothetical protein
VALFTDLDDVARARIALKLTSEYYETDQTVFAQGEAGDRFYSRILEERMTRSEINLDEWRKAGDAAGSLDRCASTLRWLTSAQRFDQLVQWPSERERMSRPAL